MAPLDELFELLAKKGAARYGMEAVNQLEHALQCATLAERSGASSALITAALFHDIGHLIEDDEGAAARGLDLRHEVSGARALADLFGPKVSETVRLHVEAKRYLCAVEPRYFDELSLASETSLKVQGGPFTDEEATAFAAGPYAKNAAALRRWDDLAKDPEAVTPDLAHFRAHAEKAFTNSEPGRMILVVGPSGAGKDSLIGEARARLADDTRFFFPSRMITRPCDPDSEDHHSASEEEFRRMETAGAFCLSWEAHGLHYGIPISAREAVERGYTVIANVSRSVLVAAEKSIPQAEVVHITASPKVLETRLHQRGRMSDGSIAQRLEREATVRGRNVTEIRNDGKLSESVAAFLRILAAPRGA